MNAIILAAGEGRRMRPLTENCPKPLLQVRGTPLIDYHLAALALAGVEQVVINLFYLGALIKAHVGDGSRYGLRVLYSEETELLETAGGIRLAIRHFAGDEPFIVVSGDVYSDFDFATLSLADGSLGHLVMVENPPHHPDGDFAIDVAGRLSLTGELRTYAGIGIFDPGFFGDDPVGYQKLRDLLDPAITAGLLTGSLYEGHWSDVGTPARLRLLNQ